MDEVLEGGPLFLASQDSPIAQQALGVGMAYFWDWESGTSSRSFLWRTIPDGMNSIGGSGSVLALGRPTDSTAQAVVFQNFEFPLDYTALGGHTLREEDLERVPTAQGGFLLPKEISDAAIIVHDRDEKRQFPLSSTKESQRGNQ